jgi:O-antigen/teichoic acid export membrane protein
MPTLAVMRIGSAAQRLLSSDVARMWLFNALRLGNFLLILPLALRTLPPEEIGLWFVMLNLVLAGNLAEFGLNSSIGRTASFLLASPKSSGADWSGLAGLHTASRRVYHGLGAVAIGICGLGFWWLHATHPLAMEQSPALIAFGALSLGIIVNLSLQYSSALLFGLHHVRAWQNTLFLGLLGNYALSLLGLLAGLGVVALAAGQACMLVVPPILARFALRRAFPEMLASAPRTFPFRELWQPAWRCGVITLGAWMLTYASIPICSANLGLSLTASYSISFQIVILCGNIAISWLVVRVPQISTAYVAGRHREAGELALGRIALALGTYAGLAIGALALSSPLLEFLHARTLPLPRGEFAALFLTYGTEFLTALCSAALVATNSLGHFRNYLASGLTAVAFALLLAPHCGIWAILLAAPVGQALFNLWHTPPACWRRFRTAS